MYLKYVVNEVSRCAHKLYCSTCAVLWHPRKLCVLVQMWSKFGTSLYFSVFQAGDTTYTHTAHKQFLPISYNKTN